MCNYKEQTLLGRKTSHVSANGKEDLALAMQFDSNFFQLFWTPCRMRYRVLKNTYQAIKAGDSRVWHYRFALRRLR